ANHIELSDGSLIANSIALGSGEGGNLQITTDSLSVTEGAQINSLISPLGRGNLGNLVINASGDIVIDGTDPVQPVIRSVIGNSVGLEAQGNAGDLIITAESLTVSNGAALDSSTFGIGNAGNIIIDVQNHTLFAGTDSGLINTTVLSSVTPAGQGQAGDVQLTTGTLSVTDGAVLASATFSQGDAGNVIINVEEEAVFDGVGMLSRSEASSEVGLGAQGNAGDVRISTGELTVSNGATLESSTAGSGDAGDVIIEAQGHVIFDGSDPSGRFSSRATSQVSTNMARGNGGDIKIFANTLDITNGAELLASTAGMGDAGDVIIVLTDEATLNNGSIFVASESDSQAGNIDISASNIQLENNSILSAESATVNGGNIFLDSDNLLLLRNNSLITATAGTAQGAGNGGNIDISAPYIIAISTENSDIIANAFEGDGGQVNITAQGVFGIEPRPQLTSRSDITASSEQGVSGIIVLNSPDNSFIENSLSELPDVLTNPDTLVANSCVARGQQAGGTFTTTGSGGLPVSPADSQIATYATGNIQPLVDESNQVNNTAPWQSGTAITEPSGIYYTADGRLIMGRDCF
ncbi:MAG: hypothetical protein KTR27_07085, partial [Leptolyngbyaceae cyanobacterium MAG.088]|nr:hypothetical protein [Leptolyngbyaceae cyanobacterium MAG.088]